MKFVENANLPNDTKIVLIGEKYSPKFKIPLENRGIKLLEVPDNPFVDERLSGHVDLSVLHLGKNEIVLAPFLKGSRLEKEIKELGFNIIAPEFQQRKEYPYDSYLNVCLCNDKLICNPKTAVSSIAQYLTSEKGFEVLGVKQGYSKCSVCIVDSNSIITSDQGIHNRAVASGMDSLLISPGYVCLDGFEYGFIGGASFKLSDNELAFTGNLDRHPDRDKIINFLSLHNIMPVYITKYLAFDIGSAIQIVEK